MPDDVANLAVARSRCMQELSHLQCPWSVERRGCMTRDMLCATIPRAAGKWPLAPLGLNLDAWHLRGRAMIAWHCLSCEGGQSRFPGTTIDALENNPHVRVAEDWPRRTHRTLTCLFSYSVSCSILFCCEIESIAHNHLALRALRPLGIQDLNWRCSISADMCRTVSIAQLRQIDIYARGILSPAGTFRWHNVNRPHP